MDHEGALNSSQIRNCDEELYCDPVELRIELKSMWWRRQSSASDAPGDSSVQVQGTPGSSAGPKGSTFAVIPGSSTGIGLGSTPALIQVVVPGSFGTPEDFSFLKNEFLKYQEITIHKYLKFNLKLKKYTFIQFLFIYFFTKILTFFAFWRFGAWAYWTDECVSTAETLPMPPEAEHRGLNGKKSGKYKIVLSI